ncbi:hypothetical protein [Nostoc sp. PA-18-2419]|nr:hypothetical protein [Nostoc sp. PA-18-2419]
MDNYGKADAAPPSKQIDLIEKPSLILVGCVDVTKSNIHQLKQSAITNLP